MNADYELNYFLAEKTEPWFTCRRNLIRHMLRGKETKRILDFGCGTGILCNQLEAEGFIDLTGYEPSYAAGENKCFPTQDTMPEGKFDVVMALDVLEHIDDDKAAINMLHTLLVPGGFLIISVPAFMTIWSEHDEQNHHYRRYTKKTLGNLLGADTQMFYWNFTAFCLKVIGKLFRPKNEGGISIHSNLLSNVYGLILSTENQLIYHGIKFPVGASIFAIISCNH